MGYIVTRTLNLNAKSGTGVAAQAVLINEKESAMGESSERAQLISVPCRTLASCRILNSVSVANYSWRGSVTFLYIYDTGAAALHASRTVIVYTYIAIAIMIIVCITEWEVGLRRLCQHNFRHNRHAKASSIMPA